MNRRLMLSTSIAALLTGLGAGVAIAQKSRKPNFIVILCDDLGFGDIEPFGNKFIKTPNLMRMATRAWC